MFLNVVSLLVGFLCLFLVALMLCSQKPNQKSNGYLIIILFVAGLQRFANALEVLGFTSTTFSPLKIRMTFAFFIVPLYYLFFKRLIRKKNSVKKELFHFNDLLYLVDSNLTKRLRVFVKKITLEA